MEEKYSILIVDDEEHVLSALERALRPEGYTILRARDGREALETLASQPVSLVISDVNMPGMNGLELLRLVKERYPDVIRVVLTGQADSQVALRAINEGEVYRFFTKPWNNDELRVTLRHILKHFELVRQARRLSARLTKQDHLLRELEAQYPGITQGAADEVFIIPEELPFACAEECLRQLFPSDDGETSDQ